MSFPTHDGDAASKSETNNSFQNIPSGVKRRRLPKTKDGWFVAAPNNKRKREQYIRKNLSVCIFSTNNDIEKEKDDFQAIDNSSLENSNNWILAKSAETESRSDLIVRSRTVNDHPVILGERTKTKNKHSSHINFKRFRKNKIIHSTSVSINIKFKSVLPKESERERQLQLSQEEIEKEQLVADALFAEGIGGSKNRRGAKSGSILKYLTPTPSKLDSPRLKRRGRRR